MKITLIALLIFVLNSVSADESKQTEAVNLALASVDGQVISVEIVEGAVSTIYSVKILSKKDNKVVTKVVSGSNIDVALGLIR